MTPREVEMLELVIATTGRVSSSREIAVVLGISPATVRTMRTNITLAFGVHSFLEAVLTYMASKG